MEKTTLPLIVLLPLLGAVLPALLYRFRNLSAWATAAVTGAALLLLLNLAPLVFEGNTLVVSWPWIPSVGLNASFRLDGLGLLFGLLILGIGLLVILYARYYLSEQDSMSRLYAFLLLFMGAMLGIVLSENLLLLLMFWELTSLSSFLLIGYWQHRSDARQGARMALAVTGAGGLALLAGIILLGHIVGNYQLSSVLAAGEQIKNHPLYAWVLVLILLGAFTKSAQFPFHFWLPHAMAAPTPVSAYLHSATMVKAGIFLLARLFPALAGTELWFYLVSSIGLITLLFGAYNALFKHDLKGLLAYSTISHLGLITLLFGLGTPLGEVAGVFHILNHAIFKASLFMAAGIIDHECGTRDMRRLNGLFKVMPYTGLLAMVAAASMAGVPLFNGFLSKEMFFAETLHRSLLAQGYWSLPAIATLAGVLSVAYSLRFIHDVFFNGEPINLPRRPHEPPRWMIVPVEILVALCLLVGMLPGWTVGPLLEVAAASVLAGDLPEYSLKFWHGFKLPFMMSLVAMSGGLLVYWQRRWLFRLQQRYALPRDGKMLFDSALQGILKTAHSITVGLENGSLQRYLVLLIGSAVVVAAAPLWQSGGISGSRPLTPIGLLTLTMAFILSVVAIGTVILHRQRLMALLLLSGVGLIVVLAFVSFSAPDLALTQLAVEVVTTVLLLLALYFIPPRTMPQSSRLRKLRDGALALLTGTVVGVLTWAVLTRPYQTIADYYLQNSRPKGGGSNVVNVILVDFRGFDTLGEITVLAIAALGIYAMLDRLRLIAPDRDPLGQPWSNDAHPVILQMVSRPLLALILLVAVYIFLRGHNLPGGGFIAGLVTALALVLQYLASGIQWTQRRLPLNYTTIIAMGLLAATLTGLTSWWFGQPFLTSGFIHVHWPVVGEFELASAMAFDLGVYLAVVGVVMLILAHLGKLSELSRGSLAKQQTKSREAA
jgi:multicomponent K+:H+ antiporter subunit A